MSLRASVVIPAHNEQDTVGFIVRDLRADLLDIDEPVIDEIVVIDSDSTDDTARVASDAGAVVYAAAEIRPELGYVPGKGEALWKSQFVTSGEVLVFMDADLIEWSTNFVVSLLEPLAVDPGAQLVKAKYDRPMIDSVGDEVELGGRVTELVARPWISVHRPELTHIVQPLSGEWAIRRSAFAAFTVPVGYGVEIAALLDTAGRYGVSAIAQADLGRRTHRNHRTDRLAQMSTQVLAAADLRNGVTDVPELHAEVELRRFGGAAEGYSPQPVRVGVGERPPAATLL